jgi:hypothetical protein
MENVSNISSEEELLQLRNEGKITEAEYQDLLATMRKPSPNGNEDTAPEIDKAKSKRKLGKIAFTLMLVGIILPALFFVLAEIMAQATPEIGHSGSALWLLLGLAFEIAAFVLGVIAWPDAFAKATVITISAIVVLVLLFTA